jgi:hypothetical protein
MGTTTKIPVSTLATTFCHAPVPSRCRSLDGAASAHRREREELLVHDAHRRWPDWSGSTLDHPLSPGAPIRAHETLIWSAPGSRIRDRSRAPTRYHRTPIHEWRRRLRLFRLPRSIERSAELSRSLECVEIGAREQRLALVQTQFANDFEDSFFSLES